MLLSFGSGGYVFVCVGVRGLGGVIQVIQLKQREDAVLLGGSCAAAFHVSAVVDETATAMKRNEW